MTIIPLRVYNHEIEGMIDNSQLDEAVAHCRHILATYPKYIASYRLLGKAHLEQQRISDATDIFQRVLSSVPDDFIANVGMSIIREDENNLDAAIWHMELAYESQPANVAIQDELRRLYGRRDGIQPSKIRLTRGALARMYAKGGLYDQAIAELRSAIADDPNRPDLQLLLAEMYYQTSQRIEAIETCTNVIKKIPFCLIANRILGITLGEAESSEAVKNYQQVAISLDPYYAFARPEAISSDQVPENAVNIERLEWKSGIQVAETPVQPNWATSLGISIENQTDENLPDWLKSAQAPEISASGEKPATSVSPFIWDTQEVEKIITDTSKPEGEIPDWMKDAGWQPASGEAKQPSGEISSEEPMPGIPLEEEIEGGEVPDWLRGIAPESSTTSETQSEPTSQGDLSTPWLEQHQPGPTDSIIQWLDEKKPDAGLTTPTQAEDLVGALDEEVPDWLKDLDVPSITPVSEEDSTASTPESPLPTPAFLNEPITPEPPQAEILSAETQASFPDEPSMTGFEVPSTEDLSASQDIPVSEPVTTSLPESGEVAEILKEEMEETPPAGISLEEAPIAGEPALLGESETLEPDDFSAESIEEIPDWLRELAEEQPAPEAQPAEIEEMQAEPAQTEVESLIDTSGSIEQAISPELSTTEEELAISPLPSDSQLPETPESQITAPAESMEVPEEEVPVDLEPQLESTGTSSLDEEPPTVESSHPGGAVAFTWEEGGAAEPAAVEGEVPTSFEDIEVPAPEWVNLDAEPPTTEKIEPQPSEETFEAIPAEEIPDWIKGLGEDHEIEAVSDEYELEVGEGQPGKQAVIEQSEMEAQAEPGEMEAAGETSLRESPPDEQIPTAEELPAWLLELEDTQPVAEGQTEGVAQPEADVEVEEEPAAAVEELQQIESEELPAWLMEIAESEPVSELPASATPIESEPLPSILEETPLLKEETLPAVELHEEDHPEIITESPSWIPEQEEALQPEVATPIDIEAISLPPIEEQLQQGAQPTAVQIEESTVPIQDLAEQNKATLARARASLEEGQPKEAVESYKVLIRQNFQLDEIINDLTDAVYRYPVDPEMWVSLGDTFFRKDQLQEALNAYNKAEELAR